MARRLLSEYLVGRTRWLLTTIDFQTMTDTRRIGDAESEADDRGFRKHAARGRADGGFRRGPGQPCPPKGRDVAAAGRQPAGATSPAGSAEPAPPRCAPPGAG